MGRVNGNNILNVSSGGGDELLVQGDLSANLEAYTVVLSAAAHVLSSIFGGFGGVIVIAAVTTRRYINCYSYSLVLTLFIASCLLNFLWSPMEVTDLVVFHYIHRHPCENFVIIKTTLYLFLVLFISIIILLLSVEGILRMKNSFSRLLRRIWPLASSTFAFISSVILTSIFVAKNVQSGFNPKEVFTIMDTNVRSVIMALTVIAFVIVIIILSALVILFIKEAVYWENGRPHFRKKKMKLEIPEFLISQSNTCADHEGGLEHSRSGTPSPSTPKLLTVGDPETASIKTEDASQVSDLPTTIVKPTGNRLGINMAQVLSRRRHTICQISDSSGVSNTPMDPIARAKQYNYVRKFSVDISALQAQLQNPKIFRDAPYLSDIDLSKKQSSEATKPPAPKPILPLKPLTGKFDEKEEKIIDNDKVDLEHTSPSNPPPPVIMVSNDDAPPSHNQEDTPKEIHCSKETFHEDVKPNVNSNVNAQKPTTLNFTEAAEEHTSAPTLESAVSDPSDTESEGRKMARLTFLMSLTFVLNVLPVVITEVLRNRLSAHAFINIYTCTLAVSTIQTIVYPHLMSACDDVVHRSIGKLKKQLKSVFSCWGNPEVESPAEENV